MTRGRPIAKSFLSEEHVDGEGANVRRSIGTKHLKNFDPFLMLDEFFVTPPAGFPDHPHRGFETVTYMMKGAFKHEDNKGHKGTIGVGDLQWMTAGRGIVHSETPATSGVNHGLQLWVNLAAKDKMCEPQYQELLARDVPEAKGDGILVKVIAGTCMGVTARVHTRTPTMYLDVFLDAGKTFSTRVPPEYKGFIYIVQGEGNFGSNAKQGKPHTFMVLGDGEDVVVTAESSLRFAVIAGKPLNEPIVQYGPFVMNSDEEIRQAFKDYQAGKF
eukprot:CAMPEP_0184672382 /NCGR_PEP_ID=MMETSP0308-20130426/86068_1 /TAXON_ID=38269 /ORGANISM="Gloeochaete witrockiana, Strain SAG 46.84" /LENGTH=271 /DNA_ID=CAMNT_0027119703 /DNA_START=192 /DNA_END=1007 /DNA_ORIENTATION=+